MDAIYVRARTCSEILAIWTKKQPNFDLIAYVKP